MSISKAEYFRKINRLSQLEDEYLQNASRWQRIDHAAALPGAMNVFWRFGRFPNPPMFQTVVWGSLFYFFSYIGLYFFLILVSSTAKREWLLFKYPEADLVVILAMAFIGHMSARQAHKTRKRMNVDWEEL